MKVKQKESFYAKEKFKMRSRCQRCGRICLLEKVYVGYNGPYRFYFCKECIKSVEEAREASKIKRPTFQPVRPST